MLQVASSHGYLEIVRILVNTFRVDVNAKDGGGDSALFDALSKKHYECAKFLVANGANVSAQDNDGHSLLMYALGNYNNETAEFFLTNGANMSAVNNNGDTAMHIMGDECVDIMRKMISVYGIDPNIRSSIGDTALHRAAANGRMKIAKMLLDEFKCDINMRRSDGDTPIHRAIANNRKEMVQFLLDRGADLYTTNGENKRPIDMFNGKNLTTDDVTTMNLLVVAMKKHTIQPAPVDKSPMLMHLAMVTWPTLNTQQKQELLDRALPDEISFLKSILGEAF
jgi:ankyrin repeat protein